MNLRELAPPSDLPAPDARIPSVVVRLAVAVLGILLTILVYGANSWLVLGVPFSLLAAWAPEYLLSWVVVVFLAIGELNRPAGLTWQLLVLLAGVHLLHVLGMLSLGLPARSWVQPRVFMLVLRRFLAIQVPVQLLAVVMLLLLAPNNHGHRPLTAAVITVLGAGALAALTLLLIRGAPRDS